jgi:hypothetical protein
VQKFLITLLLIIGVTRGHSQVLISLLLGDKLNSGEIEFGLDGGWSLSTLQGEDPSKPHSDYNLGFYFDIKTKNPDWLFNTGVRVKSTTGADDIPPYSLNNPDLDASFSDGYITRKLQYFHVPVMMKYKVSEIIYVQAGIQLGLLYKGTDIFTNDIVDKKDLNYRKDIRDSYHPLDGGLVAGLGYRFTKGNGMNLGVQYYYGLVDARVSDATPDQFNRCLYVNAGIPIGKGKAAAKAAEGTMPE